VTSRNFPDQFCFAQTAASPAALCRMAILLVYALILTGTCHQLPWHSHVNFRYGWQGDITPTPAAYRGQADLSDTNVTMDLRLARFADANNPTRLPALPQALGMSPGHRDPGVPMGLPQCPTLFLLVTTSVHAPPGWPNPPVATHAASPLLPILWLPISLGEPCHVYSPCTSSTENTA